MSNETPSQIPGLEAAPNPYPHGTVSFIQRKASDFRTIHTDGVWCSVGPHDYIHLIFFHERNPIPTDTTYELTSDGLLGREIVELRKAKDGYIREMEVDVALTSDNAYNLYIWLQDHFTRKEQELLQPKTPDGDEISKQE